MVYIYKKIIGTKPYYYLRASQRQGEKILVKDIAYLGSTMEEVEQALQKLPQHEAKIRKAYRTLRQFLELNRYKDQVQQRKPKKDDLLGQQLLEVEACALHFRNAFKKQDKNTQQETFHNFVIEFAFNTTSIEGNTITLAEARNLLREGLTPKDRTLREIYDVQNTEKVFFSLLHSRQELGHALITTIHKGLLENIDVRRGYRTTDVRVLRSHFEATPAPYVLTDMNLLLQWYEQNRKTLHPLVLALLFHHKFEKIHPFMDGNGRTGRMLLNYILLQNDYPPCIIRKKTRAEYLQALNVADKAALFGVELKKHRPLVEYGAQELTTNYWSIFI